MRRRDILAMLVMPQLPVELMGKKSRYKWWVDSVNGSDTNSGRTRGQAFKTLAKLQEQTIVANDRIGLARGSHWREDLNLSSVASLTIAAYGSGAAPCLDGGIIVANDNWSKSAGLTNVYQTTKAQVPTEAYLQAWEDGRTLIYVANTTLCDSTPGSYTRTGANVSDGKSANGNQTFYVHAGDSSDVTANGKCYEVTDPARLGQLLLGAGARVSGVWTRRNAHSDGSLVAGVGSVITDCTFSEGVKHEALINSGAYIGCIAWHPADDARTSCSSMHFYTPNGAGLDCRFERCSVLGPSKTSTQSVSAYGGHNSGVAGQYYATCVSVDCTAEDCTTAAMVAPANSNSIDRCYIKNCKTGIFAHSANASVVAIRDPYIVSDFVGTAFTLATPIMVYECGASIEGLRAYITKDCIGAVMHYGSVSLRRSVVVFDDIDNWLACVYPSTQTNIPLAIDGVVCVNLESAVDKASFMEFYGSTVASDWTSDNNVLSPAGLNATIAGTGYASVANYFTGVRPTREANSVQADPQLVDPANGNFSIGNATVAALPTGLERPSIVYTAPPTTVEMLALVDAL